VPLRGESEHPLRGSPTILIATAVLLVVALAALLGRIGADSQWLAALGHAIATHHAIPPGVPFAAAPTSHWPNALVLAELLFNGLERAMGDRGLMLAQLLAVAGAFAVLAADARAGGSGPVGTSATLLIAGIGSLPSLAIARVQLFSVVLFPVLVALLRAQSRRPSSRIWLVVPLLALWSNLHAAALLGVLVVWVYLTADFKRRARWTSLGVGVASLAALCATPALARTPDYYQGVLTNLAAERGEGMWGPLSLSVPLDLVLIGAAVLLCVRLRRSRLEPWEWTVAVVLAALTIKASRDGVWLLFFLVAPAARALKPRRTWERLVPAGVGLSLAAIGLAAARGPITVGASRGLVASAVALAHGSPVLAGGAIDEQVALAGGRIWVGDPLDAFPRSDQAAYLDWLNGDASGRRALTPQVRVVLVARGSASQALMTRTEGFVEIAADRSATIYERQGSPVAGLR